MDAVEGTIGSIRFLIQFLTIIQRARGFEDEFEFYQLQLKAHLSRCATVSRIIHDTNGTDEILVSNAIERSTHTSGHQEPTIAEIIPAIQDRLRKAQQEAAKIEAGYLTTNPPQQEAETIRVRMMGFLDKQRFQAAKRVEGIKWALYRKDKNDKFIANISALIKDIEREVNANRESLTLGKSRIIYIARAHSSAM
ncbi:uncharacterized protein Triagg1_8663 [Trichoderma aggressivum f. europaeum]|uniref:Prion-inhibition and propagation HeLo domain-containing protein n=1 Tax=Trichoderma aggressivum f. europaeum TaxID=173218 RepID=A0AAE1I9T3_9HYPO|nr:hypothetical protein Triagg1_8663 [Trichoderma aggressivum f. europaeum]